MLFDEPLSEQSGHPAPKPRHSPSIIALLLVSLVAGAVGGSLMTLFGRPLLQQFSANPNTVNSVVGVNPLQTVSIQEESATTQAVKKTSPAVVSIIISKDLSKINPQIPFNNPFGFPFNFFFNGPQSPQGIQEVGGGTGFVVDGPKGFILTNRHVVEDTQADYTVLTNDGKRLPAKVIARDTVNDLALVQVEQKNLPQLALGDSDAVNIGQTVIAIGNALGEYRNTVTKGVISGTSRRVVAGNSQGSSESLENVFQTDAAINPGNSGGPLVDLSGNVIGINTAVNSQGQLIGFAIPSNEARRVLSTYEKYGRIVRPYLGIRYVVVTPELASARKLGTDYGALISAGQNGESGVVAGSPASKAGLTASDIILEVNGKRIDQEHSLAAALSKFSPGDTVSLTIFRQGAKKFISVKLEEFKESQ